MRMRDLFCGGLCALVIAGCTDANLDRGIAAPSAPAATTVAPAASAAGGITITLDMQPNSATAVPFLTDGKKLKDFTLDDDVNSATPSSKTFTKAKAGTYTIQAGALPGLSISAINCTSSVLDDNVVDLTSGAVTVQLEDGEAVGCIFVGSIPAWHTGDLNTRTQAVWDGTLDWYNAYEQVYGPTGVSEIGIPGSAGYSIRFSSGPNVNDFFVQSGTPAALDKDLVDPTSSSSGQFGGEVEALKLNVDLSSTALLAGTTSQAFGDLTLCAMSDPSLNGSTVGGVLAIANVLLGGGSNGYSISAINSLAADLNFSFQNGSPSGFAQAHLVTGACP